MHVLRIVAPLLVGAALAGSGFAQENPVVPDIPENESPFFVLNEQPLNPAGPKSAAVLGSPANQFPLNKTSDRSSTKMLTHFFTDMFSSVHLMKGKSDSKLVVSPTKFTLDDRHELEVTFTVFNRTEKLLKLDFPNSQRIEILVRDGNGKVVEKWSDDRAFDDVSGVVMINPGERIEYAEKIPTRDMQPGLTYSIEAALANNPEYTKATSVTPSAKAKALPNAALPGAKAPAPQAAPTPPPEQDLPGGQG